VRYLGRRVVEGCRGGPEFRADVAGADAPDDVLRGGDFVGNRKAQGATEFLAVEAVFGAEVSAAPGSGLIHGVFS
jgi:hypothetical protein